MTDNSVSLAVIGAAGRTGRHVVAQALSRGHRVAASARDLQRARELLPAADDNLALRQGDATSPSTLKPLIAEASVVLDVSGPVAGGPPDYRRRSTVALLDALSEHPDVLLVHLTGAGVRRPGDRPGVADRLVVGIMKMTVASLLADSRAAVAALDDSEQPHLVVRAPRLTDAQPQGTYRTAEAVGHGSGLRIARADLARALLDFATAPAERRPTGSPVVSQ